MSKAELITWLATLPEDSPDLERVAAIRTGAEQAVPGEGRALTITEAARRAGVSRTLIYRSAAAGALRTFTPYCGANSRVTEGELARWLAKKGEPSMT
jgi:excisionase family DNA binding protein